MDKELLIAINHDTLKSLKAAAKFAATDNLRPNLNGVWVYPDGVLYSTDAHIMLREQGFGGLNPTTKPLFISVKLIRSLKVKKGDFTVLKTWTGEDASKFKEDTTVSPNIRCPCHPEAWLPEKAATTVQICDGYYLEGVARVAEIFNEVTRVMWLSLKNNRLTATTEIEVGDSSPYYPEHVSVTSGIEALNTVEGEYELKVNASFIRQALRHIDINNMITLKMNFNSPNKPFTINDKVLIMPSL